MSQRKAHRADTGAQKDRLRTEVTQSLNILLGIVAVISLGIAQRVDASAHDERFSADSQAVTAIARRMFNTPSLEVECRSVRRVYDTTPVAHGSESIGLNNKLCEAVIQADQAHSLEDLAPPQVENAAKGFGILSYQVEQQTHPGLDLPTAQCYSVQRLADQVANIGIDPESAEYIAEAQNALSDTPPERPTPPGCRAGGTLDLGVSHHYFDGQLTR